MRIDPETEVFRDPAGVPYTRAELQRLLDLAAQHAHQKTLDTLHAQATRRGPALLRHLALGELLSHAITLQATLQIAATYITQLESQLPRLPETPPPHP